jgi:plasmid stabilization system protein ParE
VEVVFLSAAEQDVLATWSWYEEQLPGLGDQFEQDLTAGIQQLCQFPLSAPVVRPPWRRQVLSHFPHGVFYTVEGRRLVIKAVLDLRRDPQELERRLGP